jgi:error-prone DNA polymerase
MSYAELQVTTNYSFLRGASHPHEYFEQARELGISALAVTDRHSLAGMIRAHVAAKEHGIRLVVGCRLDLTDGATVLVYPTDRAAYGRLCRLLSRGKGRAGKGACELAWADLVEFGEGQLVMLVPDVADEALASRLARLREDFSGRCYMALSLRRRPKDAERLKALADLAAQAGVPDVVTNDVLFHVPERRILQDVVTCIREGCAIDDAGFRRNRFADRHLKDPEEMERLFARHKAAVARSMEIVRRCTFSVAELAKEYQYPHEVVIPGLTAQQALEKLTWEAVPGRFPQGASPEMIDLLRKELHLIEEMGYAPYFLTVHAVVNYARSQDILCQGRGSAANSAVCYVLKITSIDPLASKLLFERFVSKNRNEPPDIDVDFEHEKREKVIQWIYSTYGRTRAALCATVVRYRTRRAVREVGKVMGLSEDVTALMANQVWGWSMEGVTQKETNGLNLNLRDRRLALTIELTRQLVGFPRHLSQHPGGFVLTNDRLDELVPIEPAAMDDRQVIEWDKDDIDVVKFMKVDVLGLGMLGCMRRAFDLLVEHKGGERLDLASIPPDDQPTYAMIQKADTIGVFQIESRAQMSMLPRLKPKHLYDLTIEVAIVRPGPIQGDMVHPYLKRRQEKEQGKEPSYVSEELKRVLEKTLGIPLFQEQAMQVAMVGAGFSADEADQLRRSMATFKNTGTIGNFRERLIGGMMERGYPQDFAERIFKQLEGFGSYGFPESHAASFALIAYASSWMKCNHPDVFCAALLNAQPMGFYAPAQIVRDARAHGVEVRPVCINASRWDCTLEPTEDKTRFAVRLGLRLAKGVAELEAARIVVARGDEPYGSVEELWRRSGASVLTIEKLANADAFEPSLKLARREALWAVRGLADEKLPLFDAAAGAAERMVEPQVTLVPMTSGRHVVEDYASTGFSLRRHPVSFLRGELARRRISPCAKLATMRDRSWLSVAGIVLVRQRPGSAKGVTFITIEDEGGIANLVVWPSLFQAQRRIVLSGGMIAAEGQVQREGDVIHLVAKRLHDLTDLLHSVGNHDDAFPVPRSHGDGARSGGAPDSRDHAEHLAAETPASDVEPIRVKTRSFH